MLAAERSSLRIHYPQRASPVSFTTVYSVSRQRSYGNDAGKTIALGDLDNDGKPDLASSEDGTNIWISRNTISPVPVTVSSNSPLSSGATLNLTSSAGSTYFWTGPNGFTSTLKNPSINNVTYANAGAYTVTVTNANGCSASASTNVLVNASSLSFDGVDDYVAVPNSASLNISSEITVELWMKTTTTQNLVVLEKSNTNTNYGIQTATGCMVAETIIS